VLWYAARSVPWSRVTVAAGVVVVLMELVRRWQWSVWPLEGCAVGLLAAATAWCFDERSAEVVDTAPRPLAWRSAARATGAVALLAVWLMAVHRARGSLFGHPREVALQGVAAMLAAGGYACWRRSGGVAEPGLSVAALVVPVTTCWALVRPFSGPLPVFPYADGRGDFGDWGLSLALWSVLAAVAVLLLLAALAELRWWRPRSGRRHDRRSVDSGA
jgi:hypothetical protein